MRIGQPRENLSEDATPILDVRAVSKSFGGIVALDALDLRLGKGELRTIVGPNGCGKTTLFNVVTGTFAPDSGDVLLTGERITGLQPHQIAQRRVARKFQVPGLFDELSVSENLELPLVTGGHRSSPLAMIGRRPDAVRLGELLAFCRLKSKAHEPVGSLAHGEKQRLEIAMLLGSDAELILLDEPTAGLSVLETEATADLVRGLRDIYGKTVLVIEHDMNFVRLLGSRVVVMMRGAVFREGSYEEIRADPEVVSAYLGRSA